MWGFIFFILISFQSPLAFCDGQIDSPPIVDWLAQAQEGPPHGQETVPVEPPSPPVIPEHPPLLQDSIRRQILARRLSLYFVGKHTSAHLPAFLEILESHFRIEKRIESALIDDGFSPWRIFHNLPDIRGVLFNHTNSDRENPLLSQRTLLSHLEQIERNGTRQSLPYRRVRRAINNLEIWLDRYG